MDVNKKGKTGGGNAKQSTARRLANLIFSPAVSLIIFLVFLLWVAFIFLLVYLPFYSEYVDGCISSTFEGNGTMVTRNGNTVAFQVG